MMPKDEALPGKQKSNIARTKTGKIFPDAEIGKISSVRSGTKINGVNL